MAMGRREEERQESLWISSKHMARGPGHPFYKRLNKILAAHRFERFVEGLCRGFYAQKMGRPSIPPGVYFRMLMVGLFEGLDSERGIAWRCADSLSLRQVLGYAVQEGTPPGVAAGACALCGRVFGFLWAAFRRFRTRTRCTGPIEARHGVPHNPARRPAMVYRNREPATSATGCWPVRDLTCAVASGKQGERLPLLLGHLGQTEELPVVQLDPNALKRPGSNRLDRLPAHAYNERTSTRQQGLCECRRKMIMRCVTRQNVRIPFLLLLPVMILSGCGTPAGRFTEISLGMSKEEVATVLGQPRVARGAITNMFGQVVEVWEYKVVMPRHETVVTFAGKSMATLMTYGIAGAFLFRPETKNYWLYFVESKLVRWGAAGDWPQEADRIYQINFNPSPAITSE